MGSAWQREGGRWRAGTDHAAERWAVTIDGATPLEHGWARADDDPGDSLAEALATLRDAPVPVTAVTRVTRSNQRSLDAIGAMVRGADAWVLALATVGSERFDALGPRLAMALPWALRAVSRWGDRAFLFGAPLCLVGPHAGRVLQEPGRAFPRRCGECAARAECPGVDRRYLERFEGDELRPRPATTVGPPADPLLPASLRSL